MKPEKKAFKPFIFLQETEKELKKASWPTRQEAIKLTTTVVVVSLVVAFFIGLLDLGFTKLIQLAIRP